MGFGGASSSTIRTIVEEEVAGILSQTTTIQTQTNKLAGSTPGESSVIANWNSGTGTSAETGADLVSIGTASDRQKLNKLIVDISALTTAAVISIKLFELVNGTERKIYDEDFTVGTDVDGLPIVNSPLEIDGVLRVECESDTAGDDAKAIAYKYDLEDM